MGGAGVPREQASKRGVLTVSATVLSCCLVVPWRWEVFALRWVCIKGIAMRAFKALLLGFTFSYVEIVQ